MPRAQRGVVGFTLSIALFGAGACASQTPRVDLSTRTPAILMEGVPGCGSIGPVAIAPMNLGTALSPNLEAGAQRIVQELADYLSSKGCVAELLSQREIERSWPPHVARSSGGFERGAVGDTGIAQEGIAWLVRQLDRRGGEGLGAVVVPSVVAREVELSQAGARWDGVYRRVPVSRKPKGYAVEQITGKATVLSLEIEVFAASGERWFKGSGGLVIPFQIRYEDGRGVMQMRSDPLRNSAHIRQALGIALDPWVPM